MTMASKSLQNPADALLTFNGISPQDLQQPDRCDRRCHIVPRGTHSEGASSTVNVVSDRSTLKEKLQTLVTTYNDVQFALAEISNPESEDEEVGGALSRDISVIRTVSDTIYQAVTQDSSTPSGTISGLRDIGVTLTAYGDLESLRRQTQGSQF